MPCAAVGGWFVCCPVSRLFLITLLNTRPVGAEIDSRINDDVGNVVGFDVQSNTKVRLLGGRTYRQLLPC